MSGLLFAYGSNLAASEMEAWCPEARFAGLARLPDYRLALNRRSIRWGGGAVDVVAAPGDEVWGVLYELPEGALDLLDAKEGEGFAYRRTRIEVECGGQRMAAEAYQVVDKEPDELAPSPAYAALLVEGARERGLPSDWIARLEGVLSGPDRPADQRPEGFATKRETWSRNVTNPRRSGR